MSYELEADGRQGCGQDQVDLVPDLASFYDQVAVLDAARTRAGHDKGIQQALKAFDGY
ncbi:MULTISPECIES: hypothetical protein [Bradyrhizobium]|uniref:hypothetical protein n=1 Tax=Bradyrhizobium pachyrhizi TaxID=280333 RepID=UPI002AA56C60